MNFARLTHNQCSTRGPTLTRADPRLSPRSSIPIRPPEWFPVIQHRRTRPQIICILSRAAPSGVTASVGRACNFSLPRSRSRPLVVPYSCFVPLHVGEKSKSTESPLSSSGVAFDTCAHTATAVGRSVGRPQRDHAGGTTRSFRDLKNSTAGIIVMTRAASYTSRFSLIPRRPPCSPSSHSVSLSFSLASFLLLDSSRSRRTQVS